MPDVICNEPLVQSSLTYLHAPRWGGSRGFAYRSYSAKLWLEMCLILVIGLLDIVAVFT